ncbi:aldehyde dehydrogenase family protein [Zavarzinia sp. CC-PAN008]|uniref:aldehyde dehydrogenase family protein n=1 Tax=Zavarzinia sp. CC-PAN008 TaxID=3243332 RepID=UPI003F749301
MAHLKTITPVDGSIYVERPLADGAAIETALDLAVTAQRAWAATPLAERIAVLSRAVDILVGEGDGIAQEITWQMGRPIGQTPGEVRGFADRARHMLKIAPEALGEIDPGQKPGFRLGIKRVPLGVVAVVAPWNYPYLTTVNAVIPALAAGNAVILKHSHQTPLVAERFQAALDGAGVAAGVFQHLHLSHGDTSRLIGDRRVAHVCFTGSVAGGHAVVQALSNGFASCGLELGGKDPAYVRADADLAHAIENIGDGIFFNSGQSCCGIERVYVAEPLYDAFVEGVAALARSYRLGDPTDPSTNLGPMVRTSSAEFVRAQVAEAVASGASALVDPRAFAADAVGTPYLAPQVLVGVDHSMRVMMEETFGPVAGIMKVKSDEEAIRLMNDSPYGLTAAIWTADAAAAERIADRIDTGTVFMNRCDYLDPGLAWTGVKDTGRGATLSRVGYEMLTRPKSYHFRLGT